MQYPTLDEEVRILERHHANARLTSLETIRPVLTADELLRLSDCVGKVYVEPSLLRYVAAIVHQTRTSKAVYLGASPRASVALMQSAKAFALLQGRDFITSEDVKFIAPSDDPRDADRLGQGGGADPEASSDPGRKPHLHRHDQAGPRLRFGQGRTRPQRKAQRTGDYSPSEARGKISG